MSMLPGLVLSGCVGRVEAWVRLLRSVGSVESGMKVVLKLVRLRNPLVVPSRRRKSGRHQRTPGAVRARAGHALRREVARLGTEGA